MKQWGKIALGLVGGFAVLKFLNENATQGETATSQGDLSFLDQISAGASDIMSTLTGQKKPDFITKMTPIAAQIQATFGIDPLITTTQSALESNWGLSGLTAKANNLFGFTGDDWAKQGKSVIYMHTHEFSPADPDKIQYWSTPGDIISKEPAAGGGTDLLVNRPFRAYPTWYDSVADWAHLMGTARYADALKYAKAGDLPNFAQAVHVAGYATEPDYATELVSVGTDIQNIQSA